MSAFIESLKVWRHPTYGTHKVDLLASQPKQVFRTVRSNVELNENRRYVAAGALADLLRNPATSIAIPKADSDRVFNEEVLKGFSPFRMVGGELYSANGDPKETMKELGAWAHFLNNMRTVIDGSLSLFEIHAERQELDQGQVRKDVLEFQTQLGKMKKTEDWVRHNADFVRREVIWQISLIHPDLYLLTDLTMADDDKRRVKLVHGYRADATPEENIRMMVKHLFTDPPTHRIFDAQPVLSELSERINSLPTLAAQAFRYLSRLERSLVEGEIPETDAFATRQIELLETPIKQLAITQDLLLSNEAHVRRVVLGES